VIKHIEYHKDGVKLTVEDLYKTHGRVMKTIRYSGEPDQTEGAGMVMLNLHVDLNNMTRDEITTMLVLERMGHGTNP
jgi:hypothetical protein